MPIPEDRVEIPLRVYPNARRNEVVGLDGGVFRVRVAAPPVRGRANKELIEFLSQLLGVGRSRLSIVGGATSRDKTLAISGLSRAEVMERFLP